MISTFFKLTRAKQWIKNVLIFVPLVFSGKFTDPNSVLATVLGFVAFSFMASAVYIFNDIQDVEEDRNHPKKKFRLIASGKISVRTAILIAGIFLVLSASAALALQNLILAAILLIYLVTNFFYSRIGKHVAILDICLLASFYIIRIVAGGAIIEVPLSSWLVLTTFFGALFLGTGKRYVELIANGSGSRKVLEKYPEQFLSFTLSLAAFGTILCYSLYTTTKSFWYELSIPIVVVGFLIYFYMLYRGELIEDPTTLLYKRKSLMLILVTYGVYILILQATHLT